MRIFKYWTKYTGELLINSYPQRSSVYGGSNDSMSAAKEDAKRKLSKAQAIINGEAKKELDYEVDIVEEVIEEINENNIITRNSYGALILNSTDVVFIDIDQDKYRESLFDRLFRQRKSRKELLVAKIYRELKKKANAHLEIRIYETNNGFRLIVLNEDSAPRSRRVQLLMKSFYSDQVYRYMCIRQNCYRARLTPKPYRIKQKGIKIKFPNRTTVEQKEHENWIKEYESRAKQFATCKLIHGEKNVSNKIIYLHDKHTRALENMALR